MLYKLKSKETDRIEVDAVYIEVNISSLQLGMYVGLLCSDHLVEEF